MIKKLFRTWLRLRLYKNIGDYADFEKIFQWIYKSPIWEWNLRIFCICSTRTTLSGWINDYDYRIVEKTYSIKDAETLLRFFHK